MPLTSPQVIWQIVLPYTVPVRSRIRRPQAPPQAASVDPHDLKVRLSLPSNEAVLGAVASSEMLSAISELAAAPLIAAQAAETFGAEGQYLSAAKKLLDTRDPAYKAVTAIRGQAVALWKGMSLPVRVMPP